MTTAQKQTTDTKLQKLLNDFGYEVRGQTLICQAIRGYTSARVVGRFRDLMDACEHLTPIVRSDEFSERYRRITAPAK